MGTLRSLIETILTQPTAPFRESWVKRAVLSYCRAERIPLREDALGNFWVNVRHPAEIARARMVFVAHMDHPGMVIRGFRRRGGRVFADARWLGGGPMDIRGHEVQVFSDVNALLVFDGVVRSHTRGPRGPEQVTLEITAGRVGSKDLAREACTPRGLRQLGPWGACLWYRKAGVPAGVAARGGKWHTKAADDLVGVCAILRGLRLARRSGVVGLLTRAEESGFHGALHVIRKKLLDPRKALVVSVETSAELPGARPGGGPVVRLGDRTTVFDPAFNHWLTARAEELARLDRTFRFQRRVMDGGTCEATAFNCYGFVTTGLSTPLVNYHNQDYARGTRGPRPEAVAQADVERLVKLIAHVVKRQKPELRRRLRELAFGDLRKKLLKAHREQIARFAFK